MADEYPTVKAAAVQAAPVFLDRERSLDKACDLISRASNAGADLIVFPEGFIPGHPLWHHFHSASGEVSQRLSTELFKNSVEVPGPTVQRLAQAAKEADSYVTVGVCEKEPNTTGTMYNTQLFYSPSGELIGKHQKIRPTLGERLVHADGSRETFGTFQTDYGPMSGLICGENSHPLAIYALLAEHTRIHQMSWPPCFKRMANMPRAVHTVSSAFAYMAKAFVVSANGVLDDRMVDLLELDEEVAETVCSPEKSGGSVIVAPHGEVVSGPLGAEEDILYGDLDLEAGVTGKLTHDYAGHYDRPDMFQFQLDRDTPHVFTDSSPASDDRLESVPRDGHHSYAEPEPQTCPELEQRQTPDNPDTEDQ